MTSTNHVSSNPDVLRLDMQVFVGEEDNSVYVKIIGFDNAEEADKYADHLTDVLPLMLFESEIKH